MKTYWLFVSRIRNLMRDAVQSSSLSNAKRRYSGIVIYVLLGLLAYSNTYGQSVEKEMRPLTFFGSAHEIWDSRITTPEDMVAHQNRDIVVLVGNTYETDLPVTDNAISKQYNGKRDGYIAVMNKSGTELHYCSYIGGDRDDNVSFVRFIDDSRVVLGGGTFSEVFPLPKSDISVNGHGGRDGWVATFNMLTESFESFMLIGGHDDDTFTSANVTSAGDVIIAGLSEGGITTTANAFQRYCHNGEEGKKHDGVCIVLSDTTLLYATYYGGTAGDILDQVVMLDSTKIAFIGTTTSEDIYVTSNAYESEYKGGEQDSFLAIIDTTLRELVYGTYIGGNGVDAYPRMRRMYDELYVWSSTTSSDIKTTSNAITKEPIHETSGGPPYYDSYIMVFNLISNEVSYLTYVSGDGYDTVNEVVPQPSDKMIIALSTSSSEIMGIDRTSGENRGRNFIFELGRKSNAASFVCNSAYNGWTTIRGVIADGKTIYGYGHLKYPKDLYPIVGAIKENISGRDDVLISINEDVLSTQNVGINDMQVDINVYPNPAPIGSALHIKIRVSESGQLHLHDVLGRQIMSKPVEGSMTLPTAGLKTGVYFLSISRKEGMQTKRLVVY